MNLNKFKYIFIVVLSVLMAFNACTQVYPRTMLLENDTCVVFTLGQSKEMAKWNEKRKQFQQLYEMCSDQILFFDSIITKQEVQIEKQNEINSKFEAIIKNKNELMLIQELEKSGLKQEIKIQKRQKWISISIGTVLTTILTIIAIR